MPKYLLEVDYSAAGNAGLVECFYFTFGIRDAIVVVDLPDNVSAAAISIAVSATGLVAYKTTVLLTPEELDAASKKTVVYNPPGL
jgi:uncharacterized protein with GYD domain